MTNDELIRMGSARFQRAARGIRNNRIRSLFVIGPSSFIRDLAFVIRH